MNCTDKLIDKLYVIKSERLDAYLDAVVAGSDSAVLDLHVGRRVREFALRVWPGALVALELPADLQLEPPGVLSVE